MGDTLQHSQPMISGISFSMLGIGKCGRDRGETSRFALRLRVVATNFNSDSAREGGQKSQVGLCIKCSKVRLAWELCSTVLKGCCVEDVEKRPSFGKLGDFIDTELKVQLSVNKGSDSIVVTEYRKLARMGVL